MLRFLLLSLLALVACQLPAVSASRYYNLGSHRVITWPVDYGDYYYNVLKLKIRLRAPANLVAYTWKNTGNCNNRYFLDHLNTNTHSVSIPYSNSMVVHPWTNGLGEITVQARNDYCIGLHCHGDNTCNIEYDYYAADGCWDYTVRCSKDGALDTTRPMWTCGRYHGCGCGWNTVWKCNQCWYGPCNCGWHVVQCDCHPRCPTNNRKRQLGMGGENRTTLIQNVMEEQLLNQDNFLIGKNISIDNCFQNSVEVYNKTFDQVTALKDENQNIQNDLNNLREVNEKLTISLIVVGSVLGLALFVLIGLIGSTFYFKRRAEN